MSIMIAETLAEHNANVQKWYAIRRARGRIVTVGSIGGRVSQPLVGPYSASKFAIEAITVSSE